MRILILLTAAALLLGCLPARAEEDLSDTEMRGCFDFFREQTSAVGLTRDRYPGSPGIASVASTGFMLAALAAGTELNYISREDAQARANASLDTLLAMEREHGYFYHFVDMNTGARAWNSEVSSIDTALLCAGALMCGAYFGGETNEKALALHASIDWPWMMDAAKNQYYMAWSPEKGFAGHWDFYAEQLILYVLAADKTGYEGFERRLGSYSGEIFYNSWFGSLFTYQYSHAFVDFRGLADEKGVSWYDNSLAASRAQYKYAQNNAARYPAFASGAWGATACDSKSGYNGLLGLPPSGRNDSQHSFDGTIAPCAALGSALFLPSEAAQALKYYASLPQLQTKYGLCDAFNLEQNWFDTDVIGIDKGVTLLMLFHSRSDALYQKMMACDVIRNGLEAIGIR